MNQIKFSDWQEFSLKKDVEKIAKEFNGYGHKKAAACNLNYENESKLIEKYLI